MGSKDGSKISIMKTFFFFFKGCLAGSVNWTWDSWSQGCLFELRIGDRANLKIKKIKNKRSFLYPKSDARSVPLLSKFKKCSKETSLLEPRVHLWMNTVAGKEGRIPCSGWQPGACVSDLHLNYTECLPRKEIILPQEWERMLGRKNLCRI